MTSPQRDPSQIPPPDLNSPPGAPKPSAPPPTAPNSSSMLTADAAEDHKARQRAFITKASLGLAIACPVLAIMPPRKLDHFTVGLGISFFLSAGLFVQMLTGQGLLWHIGRRIPSEANRRKNLEERRDREVVAAHEARVAAGDTEEGWRLDRKLTELVREQEKERARERAERERRLGRVLGVADSDEPPWVRERRRREEKAFAEGKGYGALIWGQIKEVWGIRGDEEGKKGGDDGNKD